MSLLIKKYKNYKKNKPLNNEFKDLITNKHYQRYFKCLAKYKNYLRKLYSKQNKEKQELREEIGKLTNIEKDITKYMDIESKIIGGSKTKREYHKFESKKKFLKRCVKNFAKDLDKEEKALKKRLEYVQYTKMSLVKNIGDVIN